MVKPPHGEVPACPVPKAGKQENYKLVQPRAELAAPVAKTRVIDLGTISPEAAAEKAPDVETPGFFRRMMNKVGL